MPVLTFDDVPLETQTQQPKSGALTFDELIPKKTAQQIQPTEIFVYLFLAILAALFVQALFFRSITIYDFQKGLLYRKGAFIKILGAGKHYYRKSSSVIHVIDTRKTLVNLPGQEILTKDNVS